MRRQFDILRSAILAGICISIGCVVNLRVGGVAGPVLFAFGLLAVVHYQLKLYTGMAGFVGGKKIFTDLLTTLAGNIVGCMLCALAFTYADNTIAPKCVELVTSRNAHNALQLIILAMGCGFIMTTAVKFGREKRFLPLLFGVPAFILCGFYHSIADAFYFSASRMADSHTLLSYLSIVLGNYLGCNLYRIIMFKSKEI